MKLIRKEGEWGWVKEGKIEKKVNISFVPKVKTGDHILIHAGFGISIMKEEEAKASLDIFEELGRQ